MAEPTASPAPTSATPAGKQPTNVKEAAPRPTTTEHVPVGGFGKQVSVTEPAEQPTSEDVGHKSSSEMPVGSQQKSPDLRDQATATLPDGTLANKPGMSSH